MAPVKRVVVAYVLVTALLLGASVGLPWWTHSRGASRVPAWTAVTSPGELSSAHSAVDDCESCHEPHRGITRSRCVACHAGEPLLVEKRTTAFHASADTCAGCHVEHLGRARRPIGMDHDVLLAAAGKGAELACVQCHETQDVHARLFGTECASCHATSSWLVPEFLHPAGSSTECAQCHSPPPSHLMEHFEMVSRKVARRPLADVGQCYLCHHTSAWNEIVGAGFYDHH